MEARDFEKKESADFEEYAHSSNAADKLDEDSSGHARSPAKQEADLESADAGSTAESVKVQWTFTRCVAILSLCIAYVGSQILLYFVGAALTYMAEDIGISLPSWLPNANLLGISATLPFVGYITDLIGRRWAVIIGSGLLVIGAILEAACYSFAQGIVGMVLGGIGAGICEMTSFAGVAEIFPVKNRGLSLALVTVTILPFCPYVLYVQLLEVHATWRWGLCIVALWNAIGFFGLLFCYHPPPRHSSVEGMTRKQIVSRIDYGGAFLSIGGLTLFLVGMQAGGYSYPWKSGKVLGPLISGILVLIAFIPYEMYVAKYPMIPRDIFKGQKVVAISFVIAFVAGMDFYSVLNFFPILLTTYYKPDPILAGERAMGYGFSILFGATLVNALLSYTRGHVRGMLTLCAVVMTACTGALAATTPFNPGVATALSTVGGVGIGGVLIPITTIAMIASPDAFIATTTSAALCVRFVGGAVGNTIYFNIYNSELKTLGGKYLVEYATKAGLPMSSAKEFATVYAKGAASGKLTASMFEGIKGVTPGVLQAAALGWRYANANALRYVWYASIPFGVIACICCAFLPNLKRFLTNRVAVDIH